MNDVAAMTLALAEAGRAVGRTHPNPAVGAVLVKAGRVVGAGFTSPPGGPHAEIQALRMAGARARGATLFCTLEPCSHQGRTGPCTEAIIAAGVREVVFAVNDPNPLVNGKGERRLKKAGLQVRKGVLAEAAEALNRPFFKFMRTGLPWVTLKAAITLDGKIATHTGKSKWISSDASRVRVHQHRDRLDAIIVGQGTVDADDPQLTARLPDGPGRHPLRVVFDSRLESSPRRAIYDTRVAPTVVITEALPTSPRARLLEKKGVEVWSMPGSRRRLEPALRALAERGALDVLVEGGSSVHRDFLAQGLVDELLIFVAPTVFGHGGLTWTGALGIADPVKAPRFEVTSTEVIGGDVLICLRPRR